MLADNARLSPRHRLNACNDPDAQLTFATHLVHDNIIRAGQQWAMTGTLRRLLIQGELKLPIQNLPARRVAETLDPRRLPVP